LIDLKTIFKGRPSHDRYLITLNKEEMIIWCITNSIDYISFSDDNINENTIGTIQQSVVFSLISKEVLNKDLLNFINKQDKNGN
jgi:hypothetical protein